MKLSRIVLPLAFLMLPLTACKDQDLRDKLNAYFNGTAGQEGLTQWQNRVALAICNLERRLEAELTASERLCPEPPPGTGIDPGSAPPGPPPLD
jgi:hypothetical protein